MKFCFILSSSVEENLVESNLKVLEHKREELFEAEETFFSYGKRESFYACMCTLQKFAAMSGLNMNLRKLWLCG